MKKIYFLFITFVIGVYSISPVYAIGDAPIATVSSVTGNVQLSRDDREWVAANMGDKLYEGEHIKTGANLSSVEITFLSTGSRLKIGALSKLTLENDKNDVKLSFGKLFLSIMKGKGGMKTKSPVAVAAVLGTVGVIEYDPVKNDYSVTSIDGTFAVTDVGGNTANVTAGNIARLTSSGIAVEVINTIATIQANSQMLTGEFIKTGLPVGSVHSNPAGQEILQLDTANPKEKIQMNSTTEDINTFQINQDINPVQPGIGRPDTPDTSSITTINSTVTTLNSTITTINSTVTTVNSGVPLF